MIELLMCVLTVPEMGTVRFGLDLKKYKRGHLWAVSRLYHSEYPKIFSISIIALLALNHI